MRRTFHPGFVMVVLYCLVAASAMAAPRSGGSFVFCAPYGGDLFSLDMHRTARTQDYIVGINLNRSLYRWDAATNQPVIDLAEGVSISDDGRVYTFDLRKNVTFHNGRTMTADDIIWSYNRIMKPETTSSAINFISKHQGCPRGSGRKGRPHHRPQEA